jgi:hypothetical protein
MTITLHLGCTDDLLPWINDIDDVADASKPIGQYDKLARSNSDCSQVSRPMPIERREDHTVLYLTHRSSEETDWIPETIFDETMKPHIISTVPKEFETTIKILEQQIPVPTVQQVMDRLRENADRTELAKKIRDESTRSALYSHRGGYDRRGGRGNFGRDLGNKDDKEYGCTHCKMNNHTTES